MDLPPDILDAMRSQYDAMGFGFNPEGLSQYAMDGVDMIAAAGAMGLSSQEIAQVLIQKFTAAQMEQGLPRCVRQFGDATMVSMPLDDLRFIYGYFALVEAGAPIDLDRTKRALQIAHKLEAVGS
jgi:hypothetical protein